MSDDGPGTREVAYRVFAAEFDDASLSSSESDEERAPNYVVTPTGARVNRLFTAGVLTEVERVNDETRRGRVVDPSGAFVTYAGQYQPEAQTFLERADPPAFVALTGKARTFEPEDSDRVFTSVRPESLNEVDADTRDRWVVSAAEATLDRLAVFAIALDSDLRGDDLRAALETGGAPAPLAAGIPRVLDHYGTTAAYVEAVRRLAVDALELIAGDRDEVRSLDLAPDEGDATAIGPLPDTDVTIAEPAATPEADAATAADVGSDPEPAAGESEAEPTADATPSTADADSSAGAAGSTAEAESLLDDAADTESAGSAESSENETAEAEATATPDTELLGDAGDSTEPMEERTATDDSVTTDEGAVADDGGLGDFDAGDDGDDIGDFDAGGDDDIGDLEAGGDEGASAAPDPDADPDDMYQLDDEEREEIESEFGTDFATGTEVDEPGEADIDVPEPEEMVEEPVGDAAAAAADESETAAVATGEDDTVDSATQADDPADGDAGADADAASDGDAEDVDLEAAAVAAMDDLDDGDGAPREAVVERVAGDHGVEPDAVEDAIQDALMSGQCYEPGDGLLKPI
ncbi:RPA family protein [Halorubrum miltondacostae]|uniref:Rpa-associated protein n=1 Tax=Halorubrum miltondacostae TaxID=3076378 RepID=A0ABD5M906_9EURY